MQRWVRVCVFIGHGTLSVRTVGGAPSVHASGGTWRSRCAAHGEREGVVRGELLVVPVVLRGRRAAEDEAPRREAHREELPREGEEGQAARRDRVAAVLDERVEGAEPEGPGEDVDRQARRRRDQDHRLLGAEVRLRAARDGHSRSSGRMPCCGDSRWAQEVGWGGGKSV